MFSVFPDIYYYFGFWKKKELTSAHLDQRCNFSMCLNSIFGPIQHAYCDSNNRCRCKDGYVPVSHHRCAEAQYPGNRCENDNVCRSKDENSFCDSNRRDPICECKKSYIFDPEQKKCILCKYSRVMFLLKQNVINFIILILNSCKKTKKVNTIISDDSNCTHCMHRYILWLWDYLS